MKDELYSGRLVGDFGAWGAGGTYAIRSGENIDVTIEA